MIIYLSGPISARLDTYKEHFQIVYDELTSFGNKVISPHFLPNGLEKYQDYMNIAHECLKASHAIYLLQGWQDSEGAKTELRWAMDMKKKIIMERSNIYYRRMEKIQEIEEEEENEHKDK